MGKRNTPRITIESAIDLYLLDGRARRFTPRTIDFYRGRLGLFRRWLDDQGVTQLADLDAPHIKRYFVHQQEAGLSSAYVQSFGRAIRAWLNYCVRDELLQSSPFTKIKMPILEKKVKGALTADEVRRLLRACNSERDRAIVMLILDSGVRASELLAMNAGDVDLDSGAVTVQMGKGQKGRYTRIGVKTRRQIGRYFLLERGSIPEPSAPLFMTKRQAGRNIGKRMGYKGLYNTIAKAGKLAKIEDVGPHALRRTFAINCLRSGMDVHTLARLMGHADTKVLEFYLPFVQTDLEHAHDEHGPMDHLLRG